MHISACPVCPCSRAVIRRRNRRDNGAEMKDGGRCEKDVEVDGWRDGGDEGGAGGLTEAEMREDDFSPRKLNCPTPEEVVGW